MLGTTNIKWPQEWPKHVSNQYVRNYIHKTKVNFFDLYNKLCTSNKFKEQGAYQREFIILLGPTQHPVQQVTRDLSSVCKAAGVTKFL